MIWLPLAAPSCLFPPAGEGPVEATLTVPRIEAFEVVCDPDSTTWTVTVITDAWTGGASTWWTVDGVYVESRALPSVASAEDGSWDQLQATVALADDWRDVGATRTAFSCADPVNLLVVVRRLDGEPSDCAAFGADLERLVEAGLDPCPN
jgi:hypothetical protein